MTFPNSAASISVAASGSDPVRVTRREPTHARVVGSVIPASRHVPRSLVSIIPWWGYVILAGLAWGIYVPLIFFGGTELSTKPGTIGGRLASILAVGIAYFFLGVIIPLLLMWTRDDAQ